MSDQSSKVPQTDALAHLLAMFAPQAMAQQSGGGTPAPVALPGQPLPQPSQAASQASQYGAGGGMPIMNPQAWMQQGAGNFMPHQSLGGGSKGGAAQSGGQAAGAGSGKGGMIGGGA